MKNQKVFISITGCVIGIIAVVLVLLGNPGNMGFCIACFLRDTIGALKLHNTQTVQYIRPEIIGLVLGSTIIALIKKEFQPRTGSNPLIRFILGFIVMIGALVFLGCPLRMMLRIGAGDLNAVVGLVGFIIGILFGIFALNKGFSLDRTYKVDKLEGYIFPITQVVLLVFLVTGSSLIAFSKKGPGSLHAPILISLIAGLIVGILCQRTRFCTVASIRDTFMFKDPTMLFGFISLIVTCIIMNLIVGKFNLGFYSQPIAHSDAIWNLLGMLVVGFSSTLLGGCPLRQLILSGEGNIDSVITVIGMAVGAAFSHNLGLSSSTDGTTINGRIACIISLALVILIATINVLENKKKEKEN